jgi:hypothetical protein
VAVQRAQAILDNPLLNATDGSKAELDKFAENQVKFDIRTENSRKTKYSVLFMFGEDLGLPPVAQHQNRANPEPVRPAGEAYQSDGRQCLQQRYHHLFAPLLVRLEWFESALRFIKGGFWCVKDCPSRLANATVTKQNCLRRPTLWNSLRMWIGAPRQKTFCPPTGKETKPHGKKKATLVTITKLLGHRHEHMVKPVMFRFCEPPQTVCFWPDSIILFFPTLAIIQVMFPGSIQSYFL